MTGRLIDAGGLKKSIIKKLGIASEEFLLESEKAEFEEIDKAPTVDAIPVEWIEQFIKKENIDIINKIGIVDMVEKWKLHPIDFEISSEKCGAKMDGEDEQPSSEDCDQISEFVMERLKAEKTLERLGQILGEVFGKINETIDDCCNEFLKEEEKKNETE